MNIIVVGFVFNWIYFLKFCIIVVYESIGFKVGFNVSLIFFLI